MAGTTMPRPPFSAELLADLHAGNVPAKVSEQLWPAVRRDPAAMRYLHSLDQVNSRLHELAVDDGVAHPMPTEVTARLERMIDDLATADLTDTGEQVAPVHRLPVPPRPAPESTAPMPALAKPTIYDTGRLDPRDLEDRDLDTREFGNAGPETQSEWAADYDPAHPGERPSRRLRWLTAAAATAAVLTGAVVAVDAVSSRTVAPSAHPAAGTELSTNLAPSDVLTAMGNRQITGPLSTGNSLTECLAAADLNRAVLGARNVVYSGQQAVLVLLPGMEAPHITVVVLGVGCGAGNPQVLARSEIR
ncbi:hypothetical protein AB0N05_19815 [Nocardia sp. NPDC051030]|uniref:hypothetical protein n=1 Tax=Nocardia sp. NPDC051030 TaxID=3155162 RepID=UPI00343EBE75